MHHAPLHARRARRLGGTTALAALWLALATGPLAAQSSPTAPPGLSAEQTALAQGIAKVKAHELHEQAQRIRRPGEPLSDALKRAADLDAAQALATAGPQEREVKLAATMLGFYTMNSVVRRDYCRQRGVDLAPFLAEFARVYGAEYERAKALGQRYGLTEAMVLQVARAQLEPLMDTNMRELAAQAGGLGEAALCRAINTQAAAFTASIVLAPEIRAALQP